MTTSHLTPEHYAWHPSYGAEDERAAQADYERRAKAQDAIEWLVENVEAVGRINDALGMPAWVDFWAAMEAAYLAGLEDKESTR